MLEQHQLDMIGLGLVALAAFFAFVFYLGWDGGRVGGGMADALIFMFGGVAYLAPIVLFATGAVLVTAPMLPSLRPFRTGAICLIAALLLGLAAGSLGLGPDTPPRDGAFAEPDAFRNRGGAVGEGLFWLARTLFQEIGAHIIFVFLFLTGVLLLTGGSIAGLLQVTGERVASTTRRVRQSTTDFATVVTSRLDDHQPDRADSWDDDDDEPGDRATGHPPEVEPVVRATHVEAPLPAAIEARDGSETDATEPLDGRGEDWDEDDVDADEDPTNEGDELVDLDDDQPGDEYDDEDEEGAWDDEADAPVPAGRSPGTASSDARPDRGSRWDEAADELEPIDYVLPQTSLLKRSDGPAKVDVTAEETTGERLVEALGHFGIDAKVVGRVTGPRVTRHEIRLAPGTKMSKIAQLKDDLAYALAATDVRILAPIPGKQAVGVEVPNSVHRLVHLGDVFQDPPAGWSPLTVWLGKDIGGKAIGTDLAKQPHLLVAGTTGSGKSGSVNAMLSSILLRATPDEVRLVLVDPKQVELNHYDSIPHLLTPVVTKPRLAANVLSNLLTEMEDRYTLMSEARTRSLVELNRQRERTGERTLPYIVCVIEELADLMMVAPGEVEDAVIRLAQRSRAVGIHLLLATQRPSADVITGMIKANVPARIAFAVSSQIDSRVILDQNGAESLLGQGDMLFRPAGESRAARIQGAFVTEDEIERLTEHWRRQGAPELHEELLEGTEPEESGDTPDHDPDSDDLLADAISTVVQMGTASTSMLQRRLRIGYTRAGRLIDMLERRGVISGYEGSKARNVLITEADVPRVLSALGGDADAPAAAVPAGADEPA